jgi:small-conductance mechanosensitive channel
MMPAMSKALRFAFLCALAFAALSCFAQEPDAAFSIDDARAQVADIHKQLAGGDVDDAKLDGFRDQVAALTVQANALADDRAPKLAALEARLKELGPAPPKGTPEAADITAQRNDLDKQRAAVDGDIKRAKVLAVDSQQLSGEIAEARRASFQARLSQRRPSPLSATFWRDVGSNFGGDSARLGALRNGVASALDDAFAPDNRAFAFGGIAIGLLLIVFVRWRAERALMRLTADRVPHGRLRRSALAFAVVAVVTVFSGGGAQVIAMGLDWHQALSQAEAALARAIVAAVFFGGFVAGLGRALLSSSRPSWRLPPIPDDVAQRLRMFPLLFGAAVSFSVLLNRINGLANASLPATIASSVVVVLLYSVLIAWALLRARAARGPIDEAQAEAAPRPLWIGFGIAALWLGVVTSLLALVFGYVALAHMIVRQMVWLGIVVASLYLLMHLIEDVCATALSSRAKWAQSTLGVEPRVLDQFAVLCSAAFRVAVFLFALVVALAPFGTEPGDLIARSSQIGARLPLGKIELTPAALIGAMLVFIVGLVLLRTLQRWLLDKYLPTTRLDAGMRSSVTTLLGYAGGVIVFALALSELGVSVEKIAWVASALSVGIGFGLQAVVQNFVSGLILLVERPVKVGDWVVLDNAEGDIRRINVRATEIQMADRSTVIVPNSELITKTVRNVTLSNADGRVRLRIPLPLDSDAERVRDLVRAALVAHAGVLATPEPSVLLDAIEGGSLVFIAIAYIDNPRQAGSIRSDLLFDVLGRLRAQGIALASPYDVRLSQVEPR